MSKNCRVDDNETVDEAVEAVQMRQGALHTWFQLLLNKNYKLQIGKVEET